MYTDSRLQPVQDSEQYDAPDGVRYPGNYPKDEIPGLFKVVESAPPQGVIIAGFTITSDREQVWDYREKTPEETKTEALEECYVKRRALMSLGGYGDWREQADYLFHKGEEALHAYIQSVKDNFPKPE